MKTLLTLAFLLLAQHALAFDKEDTSSDFRDALLASNKDYNQAKKVILKEDNQRIDNWNQSTTTTIKIAPGIDVEPRSAQKLTPPNSSVREVTMNDAY
jgi:hypothetical protein